MPDVLFIQTDWLEHLGVLYLSAYLKSQGIKTDIIISRSPKRIIKAVEAQKPKLLAVSLSSAGHSWILNLLEKVKAKTNVPVVAGGPHPTFFPEVLAHPSLDFIIRGEGEESLYLLVLALAGKVNFDEIAGLGYKTPEIKINPLGNLLHNLDDLPFPDRLLYFKYPYYRRLGMRRVISARGCPFSCRYCYNAQLRKLYAGKGKYLRQRSVENIIAELNQIKPYAKAINFVDDSFGINKDFREEFLQRYAREIRLPFIVNLRPELVDERFASLLSNAGCWCAQIGIETADEKMREEILGRKITQEQIISAVRYLKEKNIKVLSYNMLALPNETLEQGLNTILFNQKLKIDFPRFSIFQPYPGTELGDELVRKGIISKEELFKSLTASYFYSSPLKGKEIKSLINLHKLYPVLIKFPQSERLIRKLVKLPPNPLYHLFFLLAMAIQYKKATYRSLRETLELGIKNLSLYFH